VAGLRGIMGIVAAAGAAVGVTVGGAAMANALVKSNAPSLDEWFEGEHGVYFWRGHKMAYTAKGSGRPLVLLHGIHAAASSYEWRRNFDWLSERFRVFAVDLVGFGRSARPPLAYDAEAYVSMVGDFVRDVPGQPPCVIASSLTAAFVVEAASRNPQHVDTLLLVCPTGLSRLADAPSPLEAAVNPLMRAPIVGEALFNVLASEASIRYYLANQVFANPDRVDAELVRQMYATSHARNARFAPAAFVSGALNLDISDALAKLTNRCLVVWGAQAKMAPASDAMAFATENGNIRIELVADAGLLPHEEKADWFNVTAAELFA
jgi:pimeloyl-ACP methyl ester carboxylesterase